MGQGRLMRIYDDLFSQFNQTIAQVLITRNDIAERTQYLNGKNTLKELLSMDVIPIVNENDTVSVAVSGPPCFISLFGLFFFFFLGSIASLSTDAMKAPLLDWTLC